MHTKLFSFFSTKAGKEKIQTGRLSQTELFIYFYLIMLFDYFGLTQQTLDMMAKVPTSIDYLNIWLFRIIGVTGFILFYLANGGSKGKDFLSKFFTFSFTVGIKYYFLNMFLEYLPNYFPSLASDYYLASLNLLINILMATNIGVRIYQTKT